MVSTMHVFTHPLTMFHLKHMKRITFSLESLLLIFKQKSPHKQVVELSGIVILLVFIILVIFRILVHYLQQDSHVSRQIFLYTIQILAFQVFPSFCWINQSHFFLCKVISKSNQNHSTFIMHYMIHHGTLPLF